MLDRQCLSIGMCKNAFLRYGISTGPWVLAYLGVTWDLCPVWFGCQNCSGWVNGGTAFTPCIPPSAGPNKMFPLRGPQASQVAAWVPGRFGSPALARGARTETAQHPQGCPLKRCRGQHPPAPPVPRAPPPPFWRLLPAAGARGAEGAGRGGSLHLRPQAGGVLAARTLRGRTPEARALAGHMQGEGSVACWGVQCRGEPAGREGTTSLPHLACRGRQVHPQTASARTARALESTSRPQRHTRLGAPRGSGSRWSPTCTSAERGRMRG